VVQELSLRVHLICVQTKSHIMNEVTIEIYLNYFGDEEFIYYGKTFQISKMSRHQLEQFLKLPDAMAYKEDQILDNGKVGIKVFPLLPYVKKKVEWFIATQKEIDNCPNNIKISCMGQERAMLYGY
jgi:hypothetical protein